MTVLVTGANGTNGLPPAREPVGAGLGRPPRTLARFAVDYAAEFSRRLR